MQISAARRNSVAAMPLTAHRICDDFVGLVQQMKGGDRMSKPLVTMLTAIAVAGGLDKKASITLAI